MSPSHPRRSNGSDSRSYSTFFKVRNIPAVLPGSYFESIRARNGLRVEPLILLQAESCAITVPAL